MKNQLLEGFYLHDASVEPLTGEVRRGNGSVHLPPRAMEVLLWLARNPRSLVPREEILGRVWGDGHGSDESLTRAISDIRHAFDDHAAQPTLIQTVPRRGYRLLAEPRALSESPAEPGSGDQALDSLPTWKALVKHGVVQAGLAYLVVGWGLIQVADTAFANLGLPSWAASFVTFAVVGGFPVVILLAWFLEFAGGRLRLDRGNQSGSLLSGLGRNYLAIVAAYVIATAGAGAYQWLVGFEGSALPASPTSAASESLSAEELLPIAENSIAVLRFENLDGSETTETFSAGLSEDILDLLARVPGLLVASRSDAWSLGTSVTSDRVRDRLRVDKYVEGSVRVQDGRLRVVAQLIDSETGFHLVSRPFESEFEKFGDLQLQVARLVVSNLRPVLPEEALELTAGDTSEAELDAYLDYRRGVSVLNGPRTRASIEEAMAHFNDALDKDDGYAAAHAGLCGSMTSLYEVVGDAGFVPRAEAACADALASGPRLPTVMRAVANLKVVTGDLAGAETLYRQSLEVNPRDAAALSGLARVLRRRLDYDQAEEFLRRAIELQPGNWRAIHSLGGMQFYLGRYEEAVEQFRKVVFLDPDNFNAWGNMGGAFTMMGRFEEALDALSRSLAIEKNSTSLSNLGNVNYYLGRFDEAVNIHQQAIEATPRSSLAWLSYGDALHFAGRPPEAVDAFSRARELATDQLAVNADDPYALMNLAWAEAMLGNVEQASDLCDRVLQLAPDDPYSYYYRALIDLRLGRPSAALQAIGQAVELGYPVKMLDAEPYLADLRGEPEFDRLVAGN